MNKEKIIWFIKKILIGILFFIMTFFIFFLIEVLFGYGSGRNSPSTYHHPLSIKEAIDRFPEYFLLSLVITIIYLIFSFKKDNK